MIDAGRLAPFAAASSSNKYARRFIVVSRSNPILMELAEIVKKQAQKGFEELSKQIEVVPELGIKAKTFLGRLEMTMKKKTLPKAKGESYILLKWITTLVVEPGKTPEVRELPNNLKAFELTIQGYIETVESIRPGCLIVYDGNYPPSQKPPKRGDMQGVFIIIRVDNGEPVSLKAEDIEILSEMYKC